MLATCWFHRYYTWPPRLLFEEVGNPSRSRNCTSHSIELHLGVHRREFYESIHSRMKQILSDFYFFSRYWTTLQQLGLSKATSFNKPIDHFTVVCLVTWPLNGSTAGGDLVMIHTLVLFATVKWAAINSHFTTRSLKTQTVSQKCFPSPYSILPCKVWSDVW